MSLSIDLRVLHLLCSRLCHDLVGPVGAINNGIELMQDFDAGIEKEALSLISESATRVSERLQFFRAAYGLATGSAATAADARGLVGGAIEANRVTLEWSPNDAVDQVALVEGGVKLLLNMVMLSTEALVRGGVVQVTLTQADGGLDAVVRAVGEGASFSDEVVAGLQDTTDIGELTPRTVHGYFTARIAESLGGRLDLDLASPDQVKVSARLPVSG